MDIKREKEWIEKSKTKKNKEVKNIYGVQDPNSDPRVSELTWRHCIELPDGQVTKGTKDTARDLSEFAFRENLFKDKTVADVGACDGFFSFHAEKCGAKEVLAIDPYRWTLDDRWSGMSGFNLARELLESKVKDSTQLLETLSPETTGTWDVTLFLGVFYHLINPIHILKNVASITKETIVVETINAELLSTASGSPHQKKDNQIALHPWLTKQPMLLYYPNGEINNDYTTWYASNPEYVKQFLKVEGFNKFDIKRIYGGARFILTANR